MPGYLADILAYHRQLASGDRRSLDELAAAAAACTTTVRPFVEALGAARATSTLPAVIAEVKRRSPAKGELAPGLDPAALAAAYAAGGAACLSVLTDDHFFGGSAADLCEARQACSLPVLRKDFTVCEADVYDARLMGADAVLLIAAALGDAELSRLIAMAGGLGLAALTEVHDEAEFARALAAGASLIGVNQRDLRTFSVDTERACRVRAGVPGGVVTVAESGISGPDDLSRLADAGFDAVLVGEALVVAADPAAALGRLRAGEPGRSRRVGAAGAAAGVGSP